MHGGAVHATQVVMEVSDQAMAAEKQQAAASRRRAQLSGWVLNRFQVTLAVCGIVVGFLLAFGLGFLSGVWFQTQGQMASRDDAVALADGQLDRERPAESPGPEMTFYSALTARDGTPEPTPQLQGAAGTGTSLQLRVSEAVKPDPAELDTAEKIHSTPLATAVSPRSVPSETQTELPMPLGRQQELSQPQGESLSSSEASFYSIQVGSFRSIEQAHRLQDQLVKKGYPARIGLSIVEGQGSWYRVRVGRYVDRSAADKSAQHLQENEHIDVLVMRDSS
jgi:cell division protein FtsN